MCNALACDVIDLYRIKLTKHKTMNDLLFAISIVTTILWSAGYFAFKAGVGIHVFLGIAVVATLAMVIRRKRSLSSNNKTVRF